MKNNHPPKTTEYLDCRLCGVSFIENSEMDAHMREHHTGQIKKCSNCEYRTPLYTDLHKHKLDKHQGSPPKSAPYNDILVTQEETQDTGSHAITDYITR